jgi:hypothetical protein
MDGEEYGLIFGSSVIHKSAAPFVSESDILGAGKCHVHEGNFTCKEKSVSLDIYTRGEEDDQVLNSMKEEGMGYITFSLEGREQGLLFPKEFSSFRTMVAGPSKAMASSIGAGNCTMEEEEFICENREDSWIDVHEKDSEILTNMFKW